MISKGDDTLGCIIGLAVVAGGAWWLYDHYEIIERKRSPASALATSPPQQLSRPRGLIETGTHKDGTVWRLDADSVVGSREARLAWLKEDHSKSSSIKARETATLYSINCETTGYRTLKVIKYDKDGVVQESWGEELLGKDPDYAPPRTYIGGVFAEACKPYFDPRRETAPTIRPTAATK